MRKLRLREVKRLMGDHTAGKQWRWDESSWVWLQKPCPLDQEVLVPLEQLENLTPRIRRGYLEMTYPLFPRQDEEEMLGLFLETTACCKPEVGKVQKYSALTSLLSSPSKQGAEHWKGNMKIIWKKMEEGWANQGAWKSIHGYPKGFQLNRDRSFITLYPYNSNGHITGTTSMF